MEDLRHRNSSKSLIATGKMSGKHSFTAFSSFLREFKPVYKDNRFQRITWLGAMNIVSLVLLIHWCNSTESLGLLSITYLNLFDMLCLCICALSIWVEQKKPNKQFTFGFERVEVLAVFVSTTFSCTSSIFIIKKSITRWIQQTQIHTGRLFPGILLAFFCHMLITHCMKNKGLNLVVCASDASWLQNRMSSFTQSLCQIVPGVTVSACPRINPFSLLGCASGITLIIAVFFIDIYDYHSADAIAGIFISLLNCITMYPICAYSGKILLQGTPPHITDLLDKCLHEASTFDGVLEFRNEHFWLLGFDKIVGTIHVRIRRDANEQVVLSHLLNKLSSLVTDITIQVTKSVFKDEWAWSSSTRQILNDSYMKFPPTSEAYASTTSSSLTSTTKPIILNVNPSLKDTFSSTYSTPSVKTLSHSKPVGTGFANIPLPPSLSSSSHTTKTSNLQYFSIDMAGTNYVPKHDANQQSAMQVMYSSETSASKYNRELSINPSAVSHDYIKSYKT
ncbi:zinc transporter 6-like isoform X3 [Uloborus diversus]|uniref:zinc transporter 6-like isoform X3 n=1 Tax=Uloborus diversus TaxID=327109 RepID=UPI00240960A1|nr:zinc transporter 6-like isoform X3 [Uloborus diversus]